LYSLAWFGVSLTLALVSPTQADAQDLIVGVYDNPPLISLEDEANPSGFVATLFADIADVNDWSVSYRIGVYSELLKAAENGEIDILLAVARTPNREKMLAFSNEPILANWGELLAREGLTIETPLDLDGLRIAAVRDDVYLEGQLGLRALLAELGGKARFIIAEGYREAVDLVKQGEVDAVILNRLVSRYGVDSSGLVSTPVFFSPIAIQIAVSPLLPEKDQIIEQYDRTLKQLKSTSTSSYHRELDQLMTGGSTLRLNRIAVGAAGALLVLLMVAVTFGFLLCRASARFKHASLTDPLTGVSNRRAFFEEAEKAFHQADRFGGSLSVLMIDADRFKAINDSHGHSAGDTVLRHISGILKETVRRSDTVGRLGGEEFGVILPNANLENAGALASRIRERLEQNSAVYRNKTIPCTVSIGVSERRPSDDSFEDIMRRADGAAYKAKQSGRNTVSVAEIDGGGLQMA